MLRFVLALGLLLCLAVPVYASKIAIVIDDIGNNKNDLKAALLPGNISFAVLPYTPYARAFALRAHHQKKQILLHMPMEAVENNHPGPGVVTADMNNAQIKLQLVNALDSIPYVTGVNNHMGSKLTQLQVPMQAVMETLAARKLFLLIAGHLSSALQNKWRENLVYEHHIGMCFLITRLMSPIYGSNLSNC